MRIRVEPSYRHGLKALPPNRRKAANAAILKFMGEPSTKSLRFRPLRGRKGYFIINLTKGDRIILRRDEEDLYAVIDVGPHDNVYRRWNR